MRSEKQEALLPSSTNLPGMNERPDAWRHGRCASPILVQTAKSKPGCYGRVYSRVFSCVRSGVSATSCSIISLGSPDRFTRSKASYGAPVAV